MYHLVKKTFYPPDREVKWKNLNFIFALKKYKIQVKAEIVKISIKNFFHCWCTFFIKLFITQIRATKLTIRNMYLDILVLFYDSLWCETFFSEFSILFLKYYKMKTLQTEWIVFLLIMLSEKSSEERPANF